MSEQSSKRLFYFSLVVLTVVILGWFGSWLLFLSSDVMTDAGLVLAGIFMVLAGVLFINVVSSRFWWLNTILVLIGFYAFARAADVIEQPWLGRLMGVAAWVGALLLLYITWPGRAPKKTSETVTDGNTPA